MSKLIVPLRVCQLLSLKLVITAGAVRTEPKITWEEISCVKIRNLYFVKEVTFFVVVVLP